jgi:hypothetical protein
MEDTMGQSESKGWPAVGVWQLLTAALAAAFGHTFAEI